MSEDAFGLQRLAALAGAGTEGGPDADEMLLMQFVAQHMQLAATGVPDPTVPRPLISSQVGRWSQSWSEEPQLPLLHLVVLADDVQATTSRARALGETLARQLQADMGESLLVGDPDQLRRFQPLAPSTQARKRRQGLGNKPLIQSGDFVRRMISMRFPVDLVQQTTATGTQLVVAFGPRPGDESSPGKYADNLYGSRGNPSARSGAGRAPIPPRMPGLTPAIRERLRRAIRDWGQQQAGQLSNEAPDLASPSYSAEPGGSLFLARELNATRGFFTNTLDTTS